MKRQTIYQGHEYVTDKSWTFGLDDDKQRQFGLHIETLDMFEATGEEEFEQFPFVVSFSIVADKVHKSFNEDSGTDKPSKLNLLMDCVSYMGGVPIDHILTDAVTDSRETLQGFEAIAAQFSPLEATVITDNPTFGTVAAQRGSGDFRYLRFKTEAAASKYIDYILEHRVSVLSMMIGFILDRPINMIGDDGWSVIRGHVFGAKSPERRGAI